jgi:hypothetical protein
MAVSCSISIIYAVTCTPRPYHFHRQRCHLVVVSGLTHIPVVHAACSVILDAFGPKTGLVYVTLIEKTVNEKVLGEKNGTHQNVNARVTSRKGKETRSAVNGEHENHEGHQQAGASI